MTNNQANWKSLMPVAFVWLSKAEIKPAAKPVGGAHHVIIATGGDNGSFDIDAANFEASLISKIKDSAKAQGWTPSAGNLQIVVDDLAITIVPRNKTKTSSLQLDRQIGLDAAGSMKSLNMSHLVLCSGKDTNIGEVMDGFANGLYSSLFFKGNYKQDTSKLPKQISLLGADLDESACNDLREFTKALLFTRFLQDACRQWGNKINRSF